MIKTIYINFADFWSGFNVHDNFFMNLLKEQVNVVISNTPTYLFYSSYGDAHKSYSCKKIFYTGENRRPNFDECDYALTFDHLNEPRHYRLPLYVLYEGYSDITLPKQLNNALANRKFCNFLVSNPGCQFRNDFFHKLNDYKPVDSGGSHMNTLGYTIGHGSNDKLKFQQQYKFSIAFENSSFSGYVTEKIFEPMRAVSIPIYWGAQDVSEDFNPSSFINVHDFATVDDAIEYIKYIDTNDEAYMKMLSEPWVLNNEAPCTNKLENIRKFLFSIID